MDTLSVWLEECSGAIHRCQLNSDPFTGVLSREKGREGHCDVRGILCGSLVTFAGSDRLYDLEFSHLSRAEIQSFQQQPIFIYLNFGSFEQAPFSKLLTRLKIRTCQGLPQHHAYSSHMNRSLPMSQ